MTRLLVSVRNAAEAETALAGGADLIDVKEPHRGSLGAADAGTVGEVCRTVAGRRPCSAALGELLDDPAELEDLPAELSYAKLGLAGCAELGDWQQRWKTHLARLPQGVRSVAVVYADWRAARAPEPSAVLQAGIDAKCAALLIDTWNKQAGRLFDVLPQPELVSLLHAAREAGLLTVLAGSLNLETIPLALDASPDYIAVRGAACDAGRTADLSAERVAELAACLRAARVPEPAS